MSKDAETKIAALEKKLISTEIDQLLTKENLGRHEALLRPVMLAAARVREFAGDFAVMFRDDESHVNITGQEFLVRLMHNAPNLRAAESAKGKNAAVPSTAGVINPFRTGSRHWNLTEQCRLLKKDPALAARLKAEADAAE